MRTLQESENGLPCLHVAARSRVTVRYGISFLSLPNDAWELLVSLFLEGLMTRNSLPRPVYTMIYTFVYLRRSPWLSRSVSTS